MKKGLLLFLAMLMLLTTCGGTVFAEKEIDIVLNGKTLQCDSPPQIRNDRTVVPIATIVGALGGTADFQGTERKVTVKVDGKTILFTIDSARVTVDGKVKQLDTPAVIIKDRTMIPVRFLAEELGYTVRWDSTARTVYIDAPVTVREIEDVWVDSSNGKITFCIQANADLSGYSVLDYNNPERTVLDFSGFTLKRNFQETLTADGFSGLRSANHEDFARLVIDLTKTLTYKITLSNNNTRLNLQYNVSSTPVSTPSENSGKTRIVVDAGHGGSDPGSLGKDAAGNVILQEKKPNLTIAIGVYNVLTAAGYDVIMTRYDDTYPSLKQRADTANNYNADLFVSIHNNASENKELSGTMTFYSGEKDETGIGAYKSKTIAQNIQTELLNNLGTENLNVRDGHDYYVINKTNMTAVLVEVAFMSNEAECIKLTDENFLNLAASAIANGIMKTVKPTK